MSQPLPDIYQLDRDLTRTELLEALAAIPPRLRAAVSGAHELLECAPASGGWSAFKVICHLRDCVLVYSNRFRWMIFDTDPFLPNFDEDNWVAAAADTVSDLPAMLDHLAASRGELVRMLSRLPEDGWRRTGRHEVLGSLELDPYVRHQLAHEEQHLSQIAEVLKGAARGS